MAGQKAKFARAAKTCSRVARRAGRKGSFQACMRRILKKRRK